MVDIADRNSGVLCHTMYVIHKSADRKFERLLPFHEDHRIFFFDRCKRRGSAECGNPDHTVAAGGIQFRTETGIARLQNGRTGTVTEDHRRTAVAPVDNFTDPLRTDDKRTFCRSPCEESCGRLKRKQESAARGTDIKRRA